MSIDICIDFENNKYGVFYAGQMLRGSVRLKLKEEKKIRCVYIRIYGKAICKWMEGSGKSRHTCVGQELYLNETTYLVGGTEGIALL